MPIHPHDPTQVGHYTSQIVNIVQKEVKTLKGNRKVLVDEVANAIPNNVDERTKQLVVHLLALELEHREVSKLLHDRTALKNLDPIKDKSIIESIKRSGRRDTRKALDIAAQHLKNVPNNEKKILENDVEKVNLALQKTKENINHFVQHRLHFF